MGEWDDCAATWDEDASVQEYSRKAYHSLGECLDLSKVTSLLDFGCGTGLLTDKFAASCERIVAIDPSTAMLDKLKAKHKEHQHVTAIADFLTKELIESNPCFNEKFDLIVASSVCSFLPNYEEILVLLCTLLKPNGKFVQWDWLSEDFSKQRIETALAAAGFKSAETSEPFVMEMEGTTLQMVMGVGTA